MRLNTLLRAGGLSALAAAIALGAAPAAAQDRGRARPETISGDRVELPRRAMRAEVRQQRREARAQQAPQAASARQERVQQPRPQQQPRPAREWSRAERRSDVAAERAGREWNRRDNAANDWGQIRAAQVQARAEARAQARAQAQGQGSAQADTRHWEGRRDGQGGRWQRNGGYADPARNRTYREGYRAGAQRDDWRDHRQQQNAYRNGYRDGWRADNRYDSRHRGDWQRDHRRWSHDWRRDNRYNWYSYRNHNRHIYRLGAYYAPYRDYRYSRLSIGFRLGSLFYGSRYWINDPWQYRLPAAYGPYRWVRYYDDALLVDIYSGEVVDVIHDFFW